MTNNFKDIITRLEAQKASIDKAISALREFDGDNAAVSPAPRKATASKKTAKKRVMSEEGRRRISEATKKRWAAVRKSAKKSAV
jgi:hypothetical protein